MDTEKWRTLSSCARLVTWMTITILLVCCSRYEKVSIIDDSKIQTGNLEPTVVSLTPAKKNIDMQSAKTVTPTGSNLIPFDAPISEEPLKLFDGGVIRLSDLRGKIVVVNFWASWCGPCVTEMPMFDIVAKEYKDRGVVFLGIDSQDVELSARAFVDRIGIAYAIATDKNGRLATGFGLIKPNGVFSLPTTVFLDNDGIPLRKFEGSMTEFELRMLLEFMLDAS